MDFDNPKVYGDTFISDGLVYRKKTQMFQINGDLDISKCIFWGKKAIFRLNILFFGKKPKFFYQHIRKSPRHLVGIVHGSGLAPNGKRLIFDEQGRTR